MAAKKNMTMRQYEKTSYDKNYDKKHNLKEGSAADKKADKRNLKRINSKRK